MAGNFRLQKAHRNAYRKFSANNAWSPWFNGQWNHNDLTVAAGAPNAIGDPDGYTWDVDSTQHVVYRGNDGHIHELWFNL